MERDSKGRFVKGNMPPVGKPIDEGVAREMQARSTQVKKEKKTLREVLEKTLAEKMSAGSEMTKMEYLVAKALANHTKGSLSLRDLTYLQRLLGEDTLNIKTDGPQVVIVSQQSIEASKKWGK